MTNAMLAIGAILPPFELKVNAMGLVSTGSVLF